MFAVNDEDVSVLVSDDLLDAPFCCNLGACHGACCVQGESGAPLEAGEPETLERILPAIRSYLRPEALEVIDKDGVCEEVGKGQYATTCVDGAECVFVTYDGPVAKCAVQKAHSEGRIDFPKPISCHLYPVRIEHLRDVDTLNYERLSICKPAVKRGRREGVDVCEFVREPLVRMYGSAWYDSFRDACEERKRQLDKSIA